MLRRWHPYRKAQSPFREALPQRQGTHPSPFPYSAVSTRGAPSLEGTAYRFAVLAGDGREAEAARHLTERGHKVAAFGTVLPVDAPLRVASLEEALHNADFILGPALGTVDGGHALYGLHGRLVLPEDLPSLLQPPIPWIMGRVDGWLAEVLAASDGVAWEYGRDEGYRMSNAILTAEAAIAEGSRRAGCSVWGSRALVLGAGRCGQAIAERLTLLGANTIVASQPAIAGGIALADIACEASRVDLVFNTIPARVIERDFLAQLHDAAVVVDIASEPGGTDFGAARALGKTAVLLPGLPGRMFPRSAGCLIAEAVLTWIGQSH